MTAAPEAEAVLWALADEVERAPVLGLADMPPHARAFLLAWLATPREGCEHAAGAVLYSCAGYRRAVCADCARRARLDVLVTRCGQCQASVAHDDGALSAIYAIGDGLIVALALCARCVGAT